MTTDINTNYAANSATNVQNEGSVNSQFGCSVQFMYAQLQMELASANKDKALEKIESIRIDQQTSANYTSTINAMRDLKGYDCEKYGDLPTSKSEIESELATAKAALADLKALEDTDSEYAKANKKNSDTWKTQDSSTNYWYENKYIKDASAFDPLRVGGKTDHNIGEIQSGIKALETRIAALENMQTIVTAQTATDPATNILSDCNITISGHFTDDNLDSWIASFEASQEEIGTDIQQEMVFIQDYMGQYNSYTQGASSAISEANDTLKTVARG